MFFNVFLYTFVKHDYSPFYNYIFFQFLYSIIRGMHFNNSDNKRSFPSYGFYKTLFYVKLLYKDFQLFN